MDMICSKFVVSIIKHSCRGQYDVERCRRSCQTGREPQYMEKEAVGVDGNNTKVISSRQDRCVMLCVDVGTK